MDPKKSSSYAEAQSTCLRALGTLTEAVCLAALTSPNMKKQQACEKIASATDKLAGQANLLGQDVKQLVHATILSESSRWLRES